MAKITFITKDQETIVAEADSGSVMELAVEHNVKGIDALDSSGFFSYFVFGHLDEDRTRYKDYTKESFEADFRADDILFEKFIDFLIGSNYRMDYYAHEERIKLYLKASLAEQLFNADLYAKIKSKEDKKIGAVKISRRIGYDETDAMAGKLAFGSLRKDNHLELMKSELSARKISYDSTINWTQAKKKLKENIKEAMEKEMDENKREREEISITSIKSFHPLFSTVQGWKEKGYFGK